MARRLFAWWCLWAAAAWGLTHWPLAGLPPRPLPTAVWDVDELQPGQRGYGLSVFRGTQIERFEVEILGVLKNTSPGRDMVLARCSGCNLEHTGVIAGMSGSPIYVDGRLVGALAFAWPFGKEPIAGITPFTQMQDYAEVALRSAAKPVGALHPLPQAVRVEGRWLEAVAVLPARPAAPPTDALTLAPLQTPLAMTGFTPRLQQFLSEQLGSGFAPVPMGAATAAVRGRHRLEPLRPGSPLATALIQGDFDLSGIGTVTEVRGDRVWGWGHPFMSLGKCELPLLYGYVHTVLPRQTVSFKMGSPLRFIGTLEADVSTGIAGRLGKSPELLPVEVTVCRETAASVRTYRCQVVRHKQLTPQLVHALLSNSVDTEGELPDELTTELEVRLDLEGYAPLVLRDWFSGPAYSGGRAPISLFAPVAGMMHALSGNPFGEVRVRGITCQVRLFNQRTSADIEAVRLLTEVLAPGETLRAEVYLRPHQRPLQRVRVALPLPVDLPDGTYTATICDDLTHVKAIIRETPSLVDPADQAQVVALLRTQAGVQRNQIVVRIAVPEAGVVLDGQTLPQLPGSMVELLSGGRRTGVAQVAQGYLAAKTPTNWMVQGSQSVKFTVARHHRVQRTED